MSVLICGVASESVFHFRSQAGQPHIWGLRNPASPRQVQWWMQTGTSRTRDTGRAPWSGEETALLGEHPVYTCGCPVPGAGAAAQHQAWLVRQTLSTADTILLAAPGCPAQGSSGPSCPRAPAPPGWPTANLLTRVAGRTREAAFSHVPELLVWNPLGDQRHSSTREGPGMGLSPGRSLSLPQPSRPSTGPSLPYKN